MASNDATSRPGSEPVSVLTGSPLLVVLRAMDAAGVHQAAVVRRGALVGTVTQEDIRQAVIRGLDLSTPIDRLLGGAVSGAPAGQAPDDPLGGAPAEDEGLGLPWPGAEADELPRVPLFDPDASGTGRGAEAGSSAEGPPAEGRGPEPELVVPARPAPAADRGPSAAARAPADRMAPARSTPLADDTPRVVVTGGAGYLGSVLTRQLLDAGYRVTVLDRLVHGAGGLDAVRAAPGLTLVEGDVRHIDDVEPHLRGATAVLHLADLDGADLVRARSEEALQTNVLATGALVQAASYLRVRRFVYASTTAVYKPPRTATTRIGEDAPLHATSLYAKLKRAAETLVLDQAAPHFSPTVLRLGEVYGASPRPRLDALLNDVAMQATRDVRVVLRAESHAVPTVHVEDAARAFLHVLGAPASHAAHQLFNVVGANVTVLALEQLLRDLVPEIRVLYTDAEPGVGVAVGRVSGEKAHKWLGFAPQHRFAESLGALMTALAGGYARGLPRAATHNVAAYEGEAVGV